MLVHGTLAGWLALGPLVGAPGRIVRGGDDLTDDPATALPDAPISRFSAGTQPPERLGEKILFINFDGADMNACGNNNPQNDCSTIFGGVVLPYSGNAAQRAAVIQIIRERVFDFGITVTDQRPAQGDYDMEMVGNWQGQDPGFAGVAPNIDCFDNDGGEVSFTLESSATADGIAEIVLQEAAHTWGLEHVNDNGDLLYPTTSGTNKVFVDDCKKIVSDTQLNESNGFCNQVHTQFCNPGWQNSYQELLLVFGESVPDTIAPTLTITEPADGAELGSSFDFVIAIADDQSPVVVDLTITVDGEAIGGPQSDDGAYAGPGEVRFPIDGLPAGAYTLSVEGTDESGNPASDSVMVVVVDAAADGGAETTGAPGDTSGGPSVDTTGGGADDDASDPEDDGGSDTAADGSTGSTGAVDSSESGCACASDRVPASRLWWLLAALPWIRRRQRR
jgi:hypothetical protein